MTIITTALPIMRRTIFSQLSRSPASSSLTNITRRHFSTEAQNQQVLKTRSFTELQSEVKLLAGKVEWQEIKIKDLQKELNSTDRSIGITDFLLVTTWIYLMFH